MLTTSGDLVGKQLVVGGAGGGIGCATVEMALQRGASVLAMDINADLLSGLSGRVREQDLEGDLVTCVADATDRDAVFHGVQRFQAQAGPADILINTVGVVLTRPILECSVEDLCWLAHVNVGSILATTQAVVPFMQRGSAIVNVASSTATSIAPGLGLYGATKAAVVQLTRSLANELAPDGIRVNAVAPGIVDTKMPRQSLGNGTNLESKLQAIVEQTHLFPRLCRPDEVASSLLFLSSDQSRFATGSIFYLDGGNSCR